MKIDMDKLGEALPEILDSVRERLKELGMEVDHVVVTANGYPEDEHEKEIGFTATFPDHPMCAINLMVERAIPHFLKQAEIAGDINLDVLGAALGGMIVDGPETNLPGS